MEVNSQKNTFFSSLKSNTFQRNVCVLKCSNGSIVQNILQANYVKKSVNQCGAPFDKSQFFIKPIDKSLETSKHIPWNYQKILSPFYPDPGGREKINLNFYFHFSLQCLKRFYESLKCLRKTFLGTTKKCENKNLS